MNARKINQKIDDFFANVSPKELVSDLEEMGYEFTPVSEEEIQLGKNNWNKLPTQPVKIELQTSDSVFEQTPPADYAMAA
ncbi:MAG: hypothetical protein NXI25_12045 [bacterium]|nr:hypothetical protein [bacterium]